MWNYQNEIISKKILYIYTHREHTGTLINFFGWAFLTFAWLQVNHLFFDAIGNAINEHNEQIRLNAVDNCFKVKTKVEVCEDVGDNESKDK